MERLLRGEPYYHLWYLYMLLGLYASTPLVARVLEYLSPAKAWALAGCILTASALGARFGIKGYFFTLFVPYIGYFVAGHLLSVYPPVVSRRAILLTIVVSGLSIALAAGMARSAFALDIAYGYFNPLVIVLSIAVFLAFQEFGEQPFARKFAQYAFGVYLTHPFWLAVLGKLGLTGLTVTPILGIPLTVTLATALSAASTHLMLKLSLSRRLV